MSNFQDEVLVGNVVFYPLNIRKQLLKSCYYMTYKPKKNLLTFSFNHGSGGENLFEIRNVPYESAAKLAELLGLKGEGDAPTSWSKYNPVLELRSDGGEEAEKLRMEMLRLGIPHRVIKGSEVSISFSYGVVSTLGVFTLEQLLDRIREVAKRDKEELEAAP